MATPDSTLEARHALLIAAATGAAVWLGLALLTGRREAWDSGAYFTIGMPIVMIASGVLGYLAPRRPWRWGAAAMAAQALVMTVQNPTGGLLPLGLILFALLALPCVLAAQIGALVRRLRTAGNDG